MLPRFWIILLLVLAAGSATAQSGDGDVLPGPTAIPQVAPLSAAWQGDVLHVTVTQPGCLYLDGGIRRRQWLGCDEPTYLLPVGGVDQDRDPIGRELVLRNELAQTTTARLLVPSRDFRVILVLVAIPSGGW